MLDVMSNGDTIKKFTVPILLMLLFIIGATFGINRFLGEEQAILVGSFKYQIVARERIDIFQAAHSAATSLGYQPTDNKSLEDMLSMSSYLSYSKTNRDYLLIFQSTAGLNCYEGYLTVFKDKWVEPGKEDLSKIGRMVKETLQDEAIEFKENGCHGYS